MLMLLGFELPNLGKLLVKYYLKYLSEAGMVSKVLGIFQNSFPCQRHEILPFSVD